MCRAFVTSCLCILLSNSLFAASTAQQNKIYKRWHDVCFSADVDQIDAEIAKFEAQLTHASNDYLAQAYMGSCYALRAKAGTWPLTRLSDLKKSKKLMDGAVTMAPTDPRVRAVRAIASYKIPKRFNRRGVALSDFEKLIPIATANNSGLLINERQAILYYAYLTHKEDSRADANQIKSACHKLAPTSNYGKLTR